ncbi:rod shape-determining protein|uniref:Cell division protein FtsA n=1 Tax=Dendrosporobacter quercicolus TaxID=146817 RepID=A0A1G9TP88_9FIRM|nr:cell division FtsA domain-containing protein [Dendrosporobacter quercicolus]NSL48913.1 rod shape-determining protein [Dendrosporobacter quercicolus DSM 1736]SDM48925.1 cell division protein FtsA [Dendrosporobacter quercicolus]
MKTKILFALDIGTRSVVGLVGEQTGGAMRLLATERREHHTRAMLDGQIHDVPEVANVIAAIKSSLEKTCGPLTKVAVAAAGRALCTIKTAAEIEVCGLLTADDERSLELAAIQAAQHKLATSKAVADPTQYYCVGYSIVSFSLDRTYLKTLVGQKGKTACIEVIATFLPRQVIDSMQSALHDAGLEMAALTLEPIAAINVLIPPTMRHLNLVLVDVGAGTSDVAITRGGAVIGYGMVPCAGDEITEAISQKYLLDFNVAEKIKRLLSSKQKKLSFADVLGMEHKVATNEIIKAVSPNVAELAQAIAGQIMQLNQTTPQAVLLVGGGSLTPLLPEALAQALDIPSARVAIRKPDSAEGLENIPACLQTPDAVTPLGILKLAGSRTLNFVNVTLNGQPLHLFNLGNLTVADALLAGGIDIRNLHGKPGLGMTLKINGKTKFIAGTMGNPGRLELNGAAAAFDLPLAEGDTLVAQRGEDGTNPAVTVKDVLDLPPELQLTINGSNHVIAPVVTINDQPATASSPLADRDQLNWHFPSCLAELLAALGFVAAPQKYIYHINGTDRNYKVSPPITINGLPAAADAPIAANDQIIIHDCPDPTLAELLGLAEQAGDHISLLFNNSACTVPVRRYSLTVNGQPATPGDTAPNHADITFSCIEQPAPMISDVLLAAEFNPRTVPAASKVEILLNGRPAEYTAIVKNGDSLEVLITKYNDCHSK